MCSCPPFECTCSRWNFQGSPKVANSPPFPSKKLNFYGPAFCEIPSGSGMQSLSIEIDTNKHLNHTNNYSLFPHDIQTGLPPSFVPNASQMSGFPAVPSQSSCFEARQTDFYQPSGAGFRESSFNSNYSRRSCERLEHSGQAQLFLPSKRYRSAMESCNIFDKSEQEVFSSSVKRIKSENVVTLSDCTRSTLPPNQPMNTRNDTGDGLFDEGLDLLSSPFETDLYSPLVHRFNDGGIHSTQAPTLNSSPVSSAPVSTSLAELKPAQALESRPRSCQEILPGSTPRIVENSFRNCNTEPLQTTTEAFSSNSGYFPLHSQCMGPDTSNQSCSYDYDQRLAHQQAQCQSQYCNHSINITLRYK